MEVKKPGKKEEPKPSVGKKTDESTKAPQKGTVQPGNKGKLSVTVHSAAIIKELGMSAMC
jgi:hypothetical protein